MNVQEQDQQVAALRLKRMNQHKWGEGMLRPLLPHQDRKQTGEKESETIETLSFVQYVNSDEDHTCHANS